VIDNADNGLPGTITAGLLIGDIDLDGIADDGEHTLFVKTADALTLLNASEKDGAKNAELIEARGLIATWLNYLAGNPIQAGDPNDVDAQDAIQWGVDWLLNVNGLSSGAQISKAILNTATTPASSTAWNLGIDTNGGGIDVDGDGTTDATREPLPAYTTTGDIPAGAELLGVLDEYNNHGTVYSVQIATV
jgi:hypothetical protein